MERSLIGCSGWSYPWWKGVFYPQGLPTRGQLRYYSTIFQTVEVNMTFYRFPSASTVASWREATPQGFVFAAKMNRAITHYRRLRGTGDLVRSFLGALSGLGDKLGPVLVQLPPDMGPDHWLLDAFLDLLPATIDFAVEFRDRAWSSPRTHRLLEAHNVAEVLTDLPPPSEPTVTADHSYIRWHGRDGPGYEYSKDELDAWAEVVEGLPVRRFYGYFNNDQGGAAPRNAIDLIRRLEQGR